MPVAAARRIVSATVSGSSPKQFSRSAATGRSVASTIARQWARAWSRVTAPSRRPSEKAKPALVVARASNPRPNRMRALPASQGFGMMNAPGAADSMGAAVFAGSLCRARNFKARSACAWLMILFCHGDTKARRKTGAPHGERRENTECREKEDGGACGTFAPLRECISMGTSKTSQDGALFADLKRDPRKTGILPSQEIRELIKNRKILPNIPIDDAQIQPASMDLRLGNIAYRVQASFLPGRASSIKSESHEPKRAEIRFNRR